MERRERTAVVARLSLQFRLGQESMRGDLPADDQEDVELSDFV